MRRPLIGARDFEAFSGQGKQTQGRSWRLTKREDFLCMQKKKKKGGIFLFLCVERCSWKRCVQESSMEGSCV